MLMNSVLFNYRHGLTRTDLNFISDPDLCFRDILRRFLLGESIVEKKPDIKKLKIETEDVVLKKESDSTEIDIKDIKQEKVEDLDTIELGKEKADPENMDSSEAKDLTEKSSEDKNITGEAKKDDESGKEFEEKTDDQDATDLSKKSEEKKESPEKKQDEEKMEVENSDSASKSKSEKMEVDSEDKKSESEKEPEKLEDKTDDKSSKEDVSAKSTEQQDLCLSSLLKKPSSEEEPALKESTPEKPAIAEMNEVELEIKDELKITIKLPAEKRLEVQVKGSPKFSVPNTGAPVVTQPPVSSLPPLSVGVTSLSSTTTTTKPVPLPLAPVEDTPPPMAKVPGIPKPLVDSLFFSESGSTEALNSLLSQMNPIRWPGDKAILMRLQHIVHAVDTGEWPVSKFYSSASVVDILETPLTATPESNTPVRDTQTPISECSDLAPPEDLIMSLPPPSSSLPTTNSVISTTTGIVSSSNNGTPPTGPGRRGRRRRIAIDVETERAKLQALINSNNSLGTALPTIPRLTTATSGSRAGHLLSSEFGRHSNKLIIEKESLDSNSPVSSSTKSSRSSKYAPPPPAHQHGSAGTSILRTPHRGQSPSVQSRSSPNFPENNSLDLSCKPGGTGTAAAMSALSSLSSVTVTPVTLPSPGSKKDKRDGSPASFGAPMDLSGGMSKTRLRDSSPMTITPTGMMDKQLMPEPDSSGKKPSKLENMLDKLRKRKVRNLC